MLRGDDSDGLEDKLPAVRDGDGAASMTTFTASERHSSHRSDSQGLAGHKASRGLNASASNADPAEAGGTQEE